MIRSQKIDDGSFKFTPKQAVALVAHYFIGMQLIYPVIGALATRFIYGYVGIHPSFQMAIYILTLIVSVAIVREPLKASWRYFSRSKEILKQNIIEVFRSWGYLMLFSIIAGLVAQKILGAGSQAGNQVAIENQFNMYPVLIAFTTVGFAPIVEELVFRGALYQQFRDHKSYWKAIIISSLIFGSIHVLPIFAESHDPREFIYLIVYCGMSWFMIRAFEKTDSIVGAMGVHFLNNSFALIIMMIG